MRTIFLCFLLFFVCLNSFAQKDTIAVKKQKGFLFLTGYNLNYDINRSHVRSWGFSDYFFPSENFDKNCLLDTNKNISFKNGLRVEIFKTRNQLKSKATKFNSIYNDCYSYDSFYVVPVVIDYKVYEDTWPLDCRLNVFDINIVNGSKVRFYHERKVILITNIATTPSVYKTKKN